MDSIPFFCFVFWVRVRERGKKRRDGLNRLPPQSPKSSVLAYLTLVSNCGSSYLVCFGWEGDKGGKVGGKKETSKDRQVELGSRMEE